MRQCFVSKEAVECSIFKVSFVDLVPLGELKIGVARILLAMNQDYFARIVVVDATKNEKMTAFCEN